MFVRANANALFNPAVRRCPYALYEALQLDAPVFQTKGFPGQPPVFFVTRHEDVERVLRDAELFSSNVTLGAGLEAQVGAVFGASSEVKAILSEALPVPDTLLTADDPGHVRYRNFIARAFTPRRISGLEPRVREIAHQCIDRFLPRGKVELVREFAREIPLIVIAEQLGVSPRDRDSFARWSDDAVAPLGGLLSPQRQIEAARSLVEFQHYFRDLIAERRTQPKDDILGVLSTAQLDGIPLSVPEILSIVRQLLTAGNETTAKLIASAVWMLLERPDLLARARRDPGLLGPLVEEALRLESPVQCMFRVATRGCELAGVPIAAGAMVVLVFGAANRDEAVFDMPAELRLERADGAEHLAFGRGSHFCIGASLARLEACVALEVLLARLSDLSPIQAEPRWGHHFLLRGIEELPIRFQAAAGCDQLRENQGSVAT